MVVGCYFPWLVFAVIALFCHAQDLTTVLTTPPNVMGERREFWSTEFIFQGVSIVAHTPRTSSDIDVLIGLLSSPERSDLRQAIRETFAVATWPQPHLKYHVWFVMAGCVTSDLYEEHRKVGGATDLLDNVLHEHANAFFFSLQTKYHDLLFLNVQDIFKANFSTLPIKTFGFLQLGLAAAPSVQWYMKADDDTFIAIPRLLADLSRAREQHGAEAGVYAGHIWFNAMVIRDPASKWAVSPAMWAPSNYPDYASGGAGYVLSHNLVGCSQEVVKSPEYKYFVREDIATAITINSGCDAYETRDWGSSQTIPVLESHSTSRPSEILTNKMLTVHGVKDPNLMRELWQLLCASHVGLQSRSRRVATLCEQLSVFRHSIWNLLTRNASIFFS